MVGINSVCSKSLSSAGVVFTQSYAIASLATSDTVSNREPSTSCLWQLKRNIVRLVHGDMFDYEVHLTTLNHLFSALVMLQHLCGWLDYVSMFFWRRAHVHVSASALVLHFLMDFPCLCICAAHCVLFFHLVLVVPVVV